MNPKRVLIVGGVAGGAACAARLRRMDETAEIFLFERGDYVSFANCGLPYYLGGVIAQRQRLLVASPERFRDLFNIEVRTHHEVESIDRQAKTVQVRNIASGEVHEEAYDALVLSPGASAVRPPVEGIDLDGVFTLRNMADVDAIHHWLTQREAERAVIVGAGYIGLEMAENLTRRGLEVVVLEKLDQVMPPMDAEMVTPVAAELARNGVDLRLGNGLGRIEPGPGEALTVVADDQTRLTTDVVLLAVGVRPEVSLACAAELELGTTGGIRVDEQMRSSDPDIFAVGDAVEVRDLVTDRPTLLALAGPAVRQGRVAADVIAGREARFRGVLGSGIVGVFDLTLAMTGATEKRLVEAEIPYQKIVIHENNHAGYYPKASPITLKLLFAPDTGRILGAQAVGREGVDKRIDVIAMATRQNATVFDLEEAELCYAPPYGNARDPVNVAGFVAANVVRGDVEVVSWEDWRAMQAEPEDRRPMVLDVRPGGAQVPSTVNIPLGELRARLDELPTDREIWIHCGVGRTSYFACRILSQRGFRVRNLSGGITSYRE